MEKREVLNNSTKMTLSIIGSAILWGIVFSIVDAIFKDFLVNFVNSYVLVAIITIVFAGLMYFCIWKLSIKDAFKKKTIPKDLIPKVMKNLIIYAIFCCIINCVTNFHTLQSSLEKLEKEIDRNLIGYELLFGDNEDYQATKQKLLEEEKNKLVIFFIAMQVGTAVTYIGTLILNKKDMYKYAFEEVAEENVVSQA